MFNYSIHKKKYFNLSGTFLECNVMHKTLQNVRREQNSQRDLSYSCLHIKTKEKQFSRPYLHKLLLSEPSLKASKTLGLAFILH